MEKRKSMKCRPAAESRGSSLCGNHIVVEKKEVSNEKKNLCLFLVFLTLFVLMGCGSWWNQFSAHFQEVSPSH